MVVHTLFLLVCAVIMAAILLLVPIPVANQAHAALLNAGHALLFGVFSLLLFPVFRKLCRARYQRLGVTAQVLLFLALMTGLGLAVEYLQSKIGRDASWEDMALNTIGVVAALCWYGFANAQRKGARALCLTGLAICLFITAFEPARWQYATSIRNQDFPSINDFDGAGSNLFVRKNRGGEFAVVNSDSVEKAVGADVSGNVLKVRFPANQRWPGWRITGPFPDWQPHASFSFTVISTAASDIEIVCRINDVFHNNRHSDRFNRVLTIKPGINRIAIPIADIRKAPKNRRMEMTHIEQIIWFAARPHEDFVLYFDDIELEDALN